MAKQKLRIRGVPNLINETYIKYAAMTMVAARRIRWSFYEAVSLNKFPATSQQTFFTLTFINKQEIE